MLSKLSVKKPYTVIVGIILAIVLGVIAFQRMSTDLLPSMDLPYVVVYTPYVGATPEQVESEVTRPMESAFATLTDIKKLTSQSRDNVAVVIMQFNDGANMDTALIEISSRLDQLKGTFDDDVGAPVALKLNPDMLPVAILSVSRSDMDILELSDYVTDELVPSFEALNGVASATASGVIEQEIQVTIEQSRIDVVNSAILEDVDRELAKAERELNDAQAKISDGKRQLARGRSQAKAQLAEAEAQLTQGEAAVTPALQQLTAQRNNLAAQRDGLARNIAAMEAALNMTDAEKAAVQAAAAELAELKQQRTELEARLTAAQNAPVDEALAAQRRDAQNQKDDLVRERGALKAYLDDLTLMDADSLSADISRINAEIADGEATLEARQAELDATTAERDALKAQVAELTVRIEAPSTDAPTEEPTESPTDEPTESPTDEPTDAPTESPTDEPTDEPTNEPTAEPTNEPTAEPTEKPTDEPTESPTDEPTNEPTESPTDEPTENPTDEPTESSTDEPEEPSSSEPPTEEGTNATVPPSDKAESDPLETRSDDDSGSQEEQNPVSEENTDDPNDDGDSSSSDDSESHSSDTSDKQDSDKSDEHDSDKSDEHGSEKSNDSDKSDDHDSSKSDDHDSGKSDEHDSEKSNDSDKSDNNDRDKSDDRDRSASDGDTHDKSDDDTAALRWNRALAEGDDSPEALKAQLEEAKSRLDEADAEVSRKSAAVEDAKAALSALREQLASKERALEALSDENTDMTSRTQEAEASIAALDGRISALDDELADIDANIAASRPDTSEMEQELAALDLQIQAMEGAGVPQEAELLSEPESLPARYAAAQYGLAEVDTGLKQVETYIDKLNHGVLPGGLMPGLDEDTNLTDARAQLTAGREQMESALSQASSMLNKAEKEIAKARKEFMDKRDEALEDAGIDGILTVQTVAQMLGAQNLSMPAGYVRQANGDQVLVRVGDKFSSIDDMKRLKLFSLDLDTIDNVYLMDVADVTLADDREDVFAKLDGKDGVLLSLEKQSTYSTADVAKTVMQHAAQLQSEHPELQIVDLMNQGEYIEIVVQSVLNNLLSGGALAILVLLLFLLDFRPTLTVAFSIPISVVIAFVAMYFTGITLNVLSLSGLSLGIGMLVDNSIVSIENIYRLHEEENLPLLRACVQGVQSVAGALFSSTLTTICVFLPIVFVQGMARDLFADMGLTIAYSLLASLMVAMTVVPMMSSFLMRRSKPKRHWFFSKLQIAYGAMLRGALRVKPLVLLAAIALLAFSGWQATQMGVSFMPEVNSRQMSANLEPDTSLSDAEQKAQASAILDEMLQIKGIGSIGLMGADSGSILARGNGFTYYIMVDESAGVKNVDIARQIEAIGAKHGADLSARASTMDISTLSGEGISVQITGDDIDTLQAIARDIATIAASTEGTKDVSDGLEEAVPELRLIVDKEKAVEEGLTLGQVYQFIATKLLEKTQVSKVTLNGKEMNIQLIDGRNIGLRPEDIQDLEIEVEKTDEDVMVRIGDITEIRDASSLSTIQRSAQRRMVQVSFAIADGYAANHVSDAFAAKLKDYKLPDGYHAELSGENETVMGIMKDLVFLIAVAVLLIFLIMVAQFQSFKSPIIVMFTIPLAFTGGLLALMLTGMDLSIVSMLGFLVLSGVVVNNGIVFIDCVNQLRIDGMEKRPALVEAGRQRLRPILMTAMTTILGMSTMALGQGTGAEMMQPMAVVSIGGLTYATLMTLFVVPVLYDLFNGREMKAREIQMIREAAGLNGDEVLEGTPPAAPVAVSAAPIASVAPVAPVETVAPVIPDVPVTPVEPVAPVAPVTTVAPEPVVIEPAPSPTPKSVDEEIEPSPIPETPPVPEKAATKPVVIRFRK